MVVFSNFLVVYFGLDYSSLFCVILVSSRRRIYIYIDYSSIWVIFKSTSLSKLFRKSSKACIVVVRSS